MAIHHPSPTGGRRITIRGQLAWLAYEDHDVVEFLRLAGLPDTDKFMWTSRSGWSGGVGARTSTQRHRRAQRPAPAGIRPS